MRHQDVWNAYDARDRDALQRALDHFYNFRNRLEKPMDKDVVLSIARVVHEVNRQYCMSHGDFSQVLWEAAPEEIRNSCLKGVKLHLDNPEATP